MKHRTLEDCLVGRQNNFNLIRLLAALMVIYGHAAAVTGKGPADLFLSVVGFKFIGGVAVDVFFVVSGFLVASSANSGMGALYYVGSRLLRIYPALFVCVGLTVFVLGPMVTQAPDYWGASTFRYLWVNATAYGTEYFLPGVFQPLHDKAVNGSLWSLAVEVKMYWIVLVLYFVGALRRTYLFNLIFFSFLIIGFFAPEVPGQLFSHPSHLSVAMMFGLGTFCYVNREYILISPVWMLFLLFFGAAMHGTKAFAVAYSLLLAYGVFYVAFARKLPWSEKIGDYSYGVYLYGWLAQQILLLVNPGMSNHMNAILASCLALMCGIISWHLIEEPALALKDRLRRFKAAQ